MNMNFFYFGHACNSRLREAKAAFCGVDVVVIAFQQQLNQANFCKQFFLERVSHREYQLLWLGKTAFWWF